VDSATIFGSCIQTSRQAVLGVEKGAFFSDYIPRGDISNPPTIRRF
jgi:hypothetical protein